MPLFLPQVVGRDTQRAITKAVSKELSGEEPELKCSELSDVV